MLINTKYRTDAVEIMDDFALEGTQLRDALDKIASINQFLGGNTLTLKGLQLILKLIPKNTKITIVDIGCGNGDMLRSIIIKTSLIRLLNQQMDLFRLFLIYVMVTK